MNTTRMEESNVKIRPRGIFPARTRTKGIGMPEKEGYEDELVQDWAETRTARKADAVPPRPSRLACNESQMRPSSNRRQDNACLSHSQMSYERMKRSYESEWPWASASFCGLRVLGRGRWNQGGGEET